MVIGNSEYTNGFYVRIINVTFWGGEGWSRWGGVEGGERDIKSLN